MLTVACVLRVGGGFYGEAWVRRLARDVARHLHVPHRFVCLTDLPGIDGIDTQPLAENWPGWWSKLELFKPGRFAGPVLCLDLDLMLCGGIDGLAGPWPGLVMLRDSPAFPHVANSGVMWWQGGDPALHATFAAFRADPLAAMKEHSGVHGVTKFGDQGWIAQSMAAQGRPIARWQDILPARWFLAFSYLDRINPLVAVDLYDRDARVCYALGHPKPPERPDLPIVRRHWIGLQGGEADSSNLATVAPGE